jgi:hypothetical protein
MFNMIKSWFCVRKLVFNVRMLDGERMIVRLVFKGMITPKDYEDSKIAVIQNIQKSLGESPASVEFIRIENS